MEKVKITALQAENVKRVKAVEVTPAQDGLTVIGGRNGQGKTSVLDAIAWALGGNKFKPSDPHREGSACDPRIRVELSNGLVVERKGKASALTVTDPAGMRAGQQLLDSFVEELALDLPKFLAASPKKKAETMLEIIGVGPELARLDAAEDRAFAERRDVARDEKARRAAAEAMPFYPDAPEERPDLDVLIDAQKEAWAAQSARESIKFEMAYKKERMEQIRGELDDLIKGLADDEARLDAVPQLDMVAAEDALKAAQALAEAWDANKARTAALAEADALKARADELTAEVERARADKAALLEGAALPLEGLSVDGGELVYKGQRWDNMSGSEQLMVGTAIVRAVKPGCGFVLVDELEQFDPQTLAEFGQWAQGQGLQVIGTRVATDSTCQIIIEDGTVQESAQPRPAQPEPEPVQAPAYDASKWVI